MRQGTLPGALAGGGGGGAAGLPAGAAAGAAEGLARQAAARGLAGLRAAAAALEEARSLPPAPAPEWVDVPASGQRLAVRAWGPPPGEARGTVLFLHGAGRSGAAAAGVARHLARQDWRTVAPDLRGHGASSRSREALYSPAALARDVAGLILELDLYNRPLCVAGEGLGAAVGLELAALRPKLVGLLFFVGLRGLPAAADPAWGPGMLSPPPRPPRSSVTPPGGLWCRLQGCGAFPSLAHLALALMQVAAGPCRCASAAGAARAARAMVRLEGSEGGGAGLEEQELGVDPAFFAPLDLASLCSAASGVEVPAMLLDGVGPGGREGEPAGAAQAVDVTQHVRRAGRETLPAGAGHQALAECPLAVYRALKGFLEAHESRLAADPGAPRRPEELGLRELPEFDSMDAARRALLGRALPSARAIAEALAGSDGEDAEGAGGSLGGSMTALAINPPDYFGMVG